MLVTTIIRGSRFSQTGNLNACNVTNFVDHTYLIVLYVDHIHI